MIFIIRSNRGFVWVPKTSYLLSTSVLVNGVEVKAKILDCTIDRAVTDRAGTCEIRLYNKDGVYTGAFSKGDTVKIYADYDAGTTQLFGGFVQGVDHEVDRYPVLVVKGTDWGGEALFKYVNKQYTTATAISTIFKELVAEYLPAHTVANVATISTTATPTFSNKKLLDCLKDLMALTNNNYCFYCDFGKDWHAFEKGSVYNQNEPIVYSRNLIKMSTEDTLSDVATKVTIYGQDMDGFPMVATAEDDPEGYGTIQLVVKDTNATTYEALVEKAAEVLASSKAGEVKGRQAVVRGMIGLSPGDMIYVFAPVQGLQGEYFIPEFSHSITGGKTMRTACKFQVQHKRTEDLATTFKDRIDEKQELLSIDNPYNLENSYNFSFDDSSNIETNSDCAVSDGKLALAAGKTTGYVVSSTRAAGKTITGVQLKYSGWNLGDSTFQVSVDGGLNYQAAARDAYYAPSYSGQNLRVKVTLNSTSGNPAPNVEAMCVLYK